MCHTCMENSLLLIALSDSTTLCSPCAIRSVVKEALRHEVLAAFLHLPCAYKRGTKRTCVVRFNEMATAEGGVRFPLLPPAGWFVRNGTESCDWRCNRKLSLRVLCNFRAHPPAAQREEKSPSKYVLPECGQLQRVEIRGLTSVGACWRWFDGRFKL